MTGLNYAKGLRALHGYEGASSQVLDVWHFLMRAPSNPSFETPTAASPTGIDQSTTGSYDPRWALTCGIAQANATNGTSEYMWATAGLMAGVQSSQQPDMLERTKEAVSGPRLRDNQDYGTGAPVIQPIEDHIPLRGRSGLTFQLGAPSQQPAAWSVTFAAMFGAVYRFQPQAYLDNPRP